MAAEVTQAEYLASVKTANEVVNNGEFNNAVADAAKAAADDANVSKPEYIEYAAALSNYEAREDVEPLAQRRAREAGDAFADTDFARAEGYTGGTGA